MVNGEWFAIFILIILNPANAMANYIKYLRSSSLAVMLLFVSFCACAQIKGTVTDAVTHKPIAAASVYLNGTYVGTITDSLGKFSLTTDKTNIPLIISSVGYVSQEIN